MADKLSPNERERAMEQAMLDIQSVRVKAEELVAQLWSVEKDIQRARGHPR